MKTIIFVVLVIILGIDINALKLKESLAISMELSLLQYSTVKR